MMKQITQFLGFSVVAAFVTSWFTTRVANRQIEIENITQERAKWREKIRENAEQVSRAILDKNRNELLILRSKFVLLLNPIDPNDQAIIDCLDKAIKCLGGGLDGCDDIEAKEADFTNHISALLKHDWERAKDEAKPWSRKFFKFIDLLFEIGIWKVLCKGWGLAWTAFLLWVVFPCCSSSREKHKQWQDKKTEENKESRNKYLRENSKETQ